MSLNDLNIQWVQEKGKLYLKCRYGSYYFGMPEGWELDRVCPSLLRLAEAIIFLPFIEEDEDHLLKSIHWGDRRPISNTRVGLEFSGGIDSSAAAMLLPKDKADLCYLKRVGFKTNLKHGNQLRCLKWFEERGYRGHIIETNIELLRSQLEKDGKPLPNGFTTDFVCVLPVILLADFLKLSHVTTGQIFDSTYLYKGYKYCEFASTQYYQYHKELFALAGLPMCWVVGGCPEVVTTMICQANSVPAESCLRQENGRCNRCINCFRKSVSHDRKIYISPQVRKIINTRPLKMGASMIAMSQKRKISTVTRLYPNVDVSFEYGFHSRAYDAEMNLPLNIKGQILNNLHSNARPMTRTEVDTLKKFDIGDCS